MDRGSRRTSKEALIADDVGESTEVSLAPAPALSGELTKAEDPSIPPPPPLNFMLPDAWVTPVSLPLCPPDSPELLASPPQSTQAAPQHTGSRSPRRLPDWMSHTNETCSDDHTINLLPTKIHSTYPPSTSKRSCVRRCTRDPCTHLPYKTKW